MHIFFTGATGLIGRHLCPFLLHHHDITVLSRNPTKAKVLLGHRVNAVSSLDDVDFNTVDIVINLAGEPIVNKRWSYSVIIICYFSFELTAISKHYQKFFLRQQTLSEIASRFRIFRSKPTSNNLSLSA